MKRYRIDVDINWIYEEAEIDPIEDPNGEWVKWEDIKYLRPVYGYDQLQDELDSAFAVIKALKSKLKQNKDQFRGYSQE